MSDIRPRVRIPRKASVGEVINIRTLISHPMHNGHTRDADDNIVPRHIINRFTCTFEGETVIDMVIEPSLSANPYIEFHARVPGPGTFELTWHDDDGSVYSTTSAIEIG